MNKYVIYPQESIQAISDAIKEKRGLEGRRDFTVDEMPDAIRAINSGNGNNDENIINN